jgi:hypothetical protein
VQPEGRATELVRVIVVEVSEKTVREAGRKVAG